MRASTLPKDQEDLMAPIEAVFPPDGRTLYDRNLYSPAVRSGDLLFVSGQVGSLEDGLPEPDFGKQVQLAFDKLEAVLRAAGCGFEDVVDVTTFFTDPKVQAPVVRPIRERAFGAPPYPSLTAVGATYLSGFDFEIKVIARIPAAPGDGIDPRQVESPAAPADAAPPVTRRNPPSLWNMAAAGFSQISVAGSERLAFLSGQIAAAPEGGAMPRDVTGQARMATAGLAAALAELGASARDIVMLRVYVVRATTEAFQQVLGELRSILGDAMPSITTVGVEALYAPEIRVEIEMVVSVP